MAVLSRLANFVAKQIATPANPPAGTNVLYPKSDNKWYTKDSTGVESLVGPGGTGSSAVPVQTAAPAGPATGQLWYDSDETSPQVMKMPTGVITPVGAATAPAGSLVCDGSTFDSGIYPELAAYLGDTHGMHSGTTYYLPDLRSRVPAGYDATQGGIFDVIGAQNQGSLRHSLTTSEMPSHAHGGTTGTDSPDHAHTTTGNVRYVQNTATTAGGTMRLTDFQNVLGQTNASIGWSAGSGGASARHSHSINYEGTNASFSLLQPYLTLNFVIWT